MNNKQSKHKVIYLELIRVFALFFVLYTHTGQRGMHYYQVCDNAISYWMSMFMTLVSQTSVCLFFMISGAIYLGRNFTFRDVFKKRLPRILIITFIFVLLQYLYKTYIISTESFSIATFFKYLYHGGSITQQWYLYAYIGFLLILPFLQSMVRGLKGCFPYYFLLVAALVLEGFCPLFERVVNWEEAGIAISIPLLTNVIIYTMLGYYIHNVRGNESELRPVLAGQSVKECSYKNIVIIDRFLILLAVLLFAVNTILVHKGYVNTGEINSLTYFTALYSYVIFIVLKYIGEHINADGILARIITFAGGGVFGAYLFEPQLRDITIFIYDGLKPYIFQIPALSIWLLTAMSVGILFSQLFKRVPGLGKLL